MQMITQTPIAVETVAPVTEPVTIYDARRQCNLASTDTTHDVKLAHLIASAREQWEHDTGTYFIKRTMQLELPGLCEMRFPHSPVSAITTVEYYDSGNSSQTLSSSVYQLDSGRSELRLAYNQQWPTSAARWDAVTITYVLGSHVDSTTVPDCAKSAVLLLVANEFEAPDMMGPDYTQTQIAYERLVAKFKRSTYP